MMASQSELSLDCKPHSYSMLLKSIGEQNDQTQKLEEFLSRLEEERLKIDAFKRELPLCMQLLTNAMETYRQQLQTYRANQGPRPVLEEFIPLKHSSSEGISDKASNNMCDNKATWMTSAQLWSDGNKQQSVTTPTSPKETDNINVGFNVMSPKLALIDTIQRSGGAFLPFSKEKNMCSSPPLRALPELALSNSSDDKEIEDKKCLENDNGRRENSSVTAIEQGKGGGAADSQTTTNTNSTTNCQAHRKARRCWSPDLHRRFVNALQMLGGSQVATPKQIRELMKVDGLTNDEVKSHLQKYRLHTRRPSPNPQAVGTTAPQLVVLGGIWVPPEYATAAAAHHHHGGGPALYGAHPSAHGYCAQPVPQEFYTAQQPPPQPQHHHQLHHHTLHHQLHMYNNPSSGTHNSPESDVRGGSGGDRSESIEEGKSDSGSWKAESGGENGGERKGLVMREEGDESNGSEITLKI
ncbi:hypothetical protein RJ639_039359 [Escallonia herrerae]|uniref:HTH myb-type domain-containing protein n=1 Tax=Escallonia herrerae TaxID=1293975 RepID=A0AA88WJ39_9ASTE|nr:hypothetical protein RJ639_039359 [Escallonia herrerae]